jgi:pilus assembly protein FimV
MLNTVAPQSPVSAGLDFDLGLGAPSETGTRPGAAPQSGAGPATDVTADLGFDLELGGEDKKPVSADHQTEFADSGTLSVGTQAPGTRDALPSVDFDFELPAAGETVQTAQPRAHGEVASASPDAPAVSAEGSGGIDFDFNLELPASKEEPVAAPLDLSLIDLDLGAPGGAAAPADAHWQEVATKLDLAKAYQEMGDKDGARELLNEVLKEGDAAQQQQAQTMLSALS